jgi:hypothetical protein
MRSAPALLLFAALLPAGCKSVPQIAAAVTGGTVGAATGNPALGFAVAVATDAAAHATVRYIGRTRQQAEQDAIAEVAGALAVGQSAKWRIEHDIPIGNEEGELEVVRVIDNPLAACKEIAFSVDEGKDGKRKRAWYLTTVCRQQAKWKWAGAEPAVERWGYLQ